MPDQQQQQCGGGFVSWLWLFGACRTEFVDEASEYTGICNEAVI